MVCFASMVAVRWIKSIARAAAEPLLGMTGNRSSSNRLRYLLLRRAEPDLVRHGGQSRCHEGAGRADSRAPMPHGAVAVSNRERTTSQFVHNLSLCIDIAPPPFDVRIIAPIRSVFLNIPRRRAAFVVDQLPGTA